METIVSVNDLTLNIEGKQILENICFDLAAREVLVLMGKNGSGKSVLLKTIINLFSPQKGSAKIFGKNIYEMRKNEVNDLRKKIGYVFQKSGLFDSMSVAENTIFAARRFLKKEETELQKLATQSLNRSGLKNVEHKLPSQLSGGMQKRVGIARAITMRPKLLFMDDPTAGLDPVLTDAIANLILRIIEDLHGSAIVICHDLKFARKLASRIGLMVDGRLHQILETEEFFSTNDPYITQFRDGLLEGPIKIIE